MDSFINDVRPYRRSDRTPVERDSSHSWMPVVVVTSRDLEFSQVLALLRVLLLVDQQTPNVPPMFEVSYHWSPVPIAS